MNTRDLRSGDARAVRASVAVVEHAAGRDLGIPTPCSAWTLGDLLAHMTAQHRGFAAAARGDGADPANWEVRPLAADPVAAYAAAAGDVLAAFAEPGVPERSFALPEFGPGAEFPGAVAIGFHLIDYVVHAWDVARALGVPYELDPELADDALAIARAVPGGDYRLGPAAVFAPERAAPADPSVLDRILTTLGRSPDWSAVTTG